MRTFQFKECGKVENNDFHKTEEGIVSRPLKNLEELLHWKSESIREEKSTRFVLPTITLKTGVEMGKERKMIICHDMKGGYLDDKRPGGFDGLLIPSYVWKYVSDFIYFSHNFISIPTTSWIDMAHANGARCLGTIITEWSEGHVRCSAMLQIWELVVSKLQAIQDFYGFDGWLINIENPVDKDDLPFLLQFVEKLKSVCGTVLWYDSVTINGDLKWQDSLNELNSQFFDLSSGIFLNYTWNEDKLLRTKTFAKDRNLSVYAGVDVFGRGAFGGGELNTHIAIQAATNQNLNSAIFAPGWLCEKNMLHKADEFWSTIIKALTGHKVPIISQLCNNELQSANIIMPKFSDCVYELKGEVFVFSAILLIKRRSMCNDFYNLKIKYGELEQHFYTDRDAIPIQIKSNSDSPELEIVISIGSTKHTETVNFCVEQLKSC